MFGVLSGSLKATLAAGQRSYISHYKHYNGTSGLEIRGILGEATGENLI